MICLIHQTNYLLDQQLRDRLLADPGLYAAMVRNGRVRGEAFD